MDSLTDFFHTLDGLYADGRHDEIEDFLRRTLAQHRICCGGHDAVFTAALNELGTYYRGAGRYDESVQAFEEAGRDILSYGQKDTADYATNRINLAGTLRLQHQYDRALALYEEARHIYLRLEGRQSYHYAATLNNISLVYLDQKDAAKALAYAQEALAIVRTLPDSQEEQAISLINSSTAHYQLGQREAAAEEARQALACYQEVPEKGIHYANALNLQAILYLDQGQYQQAYDGFIQAAQYIEAMLGKNEDYRHAMDNAAKAATALARHTPQSVPSVPSATGFGLDLCRAYYEEVGRPALQSQFAAVWDHIATGLVGEGSECLGFDDKISRDHDWGPSFCLWLSNEDYATFGQALQKAYAALPQEFRGFRRRETSGGKGRVGVWRISDFYRSFIGLSRAPETLAEWIRIPETFLSKATNGQVFTDPTGRFSAIRQSLLAFYPQDVYLKKIAFYAAKMAQSGQYNYKRCLDRQEIVAACWARCEFIKAATAMTYLLNKKYMPFYKWAHHGLQFLPILPKMYEKIASLAATTDTAVSIALMEDICDDVRQEWQQQGLASGTDSFLLAYAPAILSHIADESLRNLPALQLY